MKGLDHDWTLIIVIGSQMYLVVCAARRDQGGNLRLDRDGHALMHSNAH